MTCTIQQALESARDRLLSSSPTAALDAELLLAKTLHQTRTHLRAWPEHPLSETESQQFEDFISRRCQGVPVAYLLGQRDFWRHTFRVTPNVLIPRPETELLVELGLLACPVNQICKIVDLGTGSGAIAISLALGLPRAEIFATDSSPEALTIAQLNADQLGAQSIRFQASNWFQDFDESDFDLILSNPPYVAPSDPHLQQGDVRFEPTKALVSDDHGLSDLKIISQGAIKRLKPGGTLLLEHGFDQAHQVCDFLATLGYDHIQTHSDLQGHPRVTSAKRPTLSTTR